LISSVVGGRSEATIVTTTRPHNSSIFPK